MTTINTKSSFRFTTLLSIALIFLSNWSCKLPRSNSRLVVASAGRINSLDPAQASTFHALQLLSALGEPLYKLDSKGLLEPRLAASSPQISDDGLTISIPLRENILFHDGTKFNSKAMAFSLKRFMRIGTLNYLLDGRIAKVEAPSPYLLKLILARPSSSLEGFLTSINLTPVSPTAYSNHKDQFLNKEFVGTGPYRLTQYNPHQQRLEVFERYWGKLPNNNGIDLISLSNSSSLFGAFKSSEVDVLISNALDEDHRMALNSMSKKGLSNEGQGPSLEIGYITLLSNSPPLDKQLIRQAISHSIDRDLIISRVSHGMKKTLLSLIPPILRRENKSPWPEYSIKKAKELFRAAGYCENRILNLSFTYRSNLPADKLLALTWKEQIKRDLSDCLSLKLNGVESTTVYRQLGDGAFQAVMLDWRGSYPDPEAYLSPLLSCNKLIGSICKEGEAATSGSFWSTYGIQKGLKRSDLIRGSNRLIELKRIEFEAAKGAAYIPVWLVTPRAWSQVNLSKPEFDSNGYVLLHRLTKKGQ